MSQALTLIQWGCGQFAGALRTPAWWSCGWHSDWRSTYSIHHHILLCKKQTNKQTETMKTEADKHPPRDWKLWEVVMALKHSLSFSGGDRDPANSPTNCPGLTFPTALCNKNHCLVISPRCHHWCMARQRQGDRKKSEFHRKQPTLSSLIRHRTTQYYWRTGSCSCGGRV